MIEINLDTVEIGDFDRASRGAISVARLTTDQDPQKEALCAAASFFGKAPPQFKRQEIFDRELREIDPDFSPELGCADW